MTLLRLLLVLFLAALPQAGHCAGIPLIADLSAYEINLDSGFTGTHLLLFGARNEGGDVVVVLRGPERTYTIRKKKQVGGIWVNRDAVTFTQVPRFYAVGSTRPLEEIRSAQMFGWLQIGEKSLLPEAAFKTRAKLSADEYAKAFLDYQQRQRLYSSDAQLQFMGETLFKTTIHFPDTIPEGDYTAEAYLFSGGEMVGAQTIPLKVSKSGFEAGVYNLAHRNPVLYGILGVSLAVLAGWAASRIFEKI